MTDLEWSYRWPRLLPVLQDLRHGAGELLDLLDFVMAACRRKGIGSEIVDKEIAKRTVEKKARTILAYDVAPLIKQSRLAQTSDDDLRSDFVSTVFRGVDRIVTDRARPISFGPEPVLENLRDKVPSVEEAYEREQEEKAAEELQPRLPEKALRKVAPTMEAIYSTINQRALIVPIYSLMKEHPDRYAFLWGLYVALWPNVERFEQLVQAYAGATVKVPVKANYKKVERLGKVLHLRSKGLTQEKIAAQLHMKQEGVSILVTEWKNRRRAEMVMERAVLKALNRAVKCLTKAAAVDEIRAL
jgi:hypothetical protein